MTPDVQVSQADEEHRDLVERLAQFYLYDLSGVGGWDVDSTGVFASTLLDRCWTDERRTTFLIDADGHPAGFAIVDRGSAVTDRADVWDMAEFFILRRWRRLGVGSRSARTVLTRFPGAWEVRPFAGHEMARLFWAGMCEEIAAAQVEVGHYHRSDGKERSVLRFTVA